MKLSDLTQNQSTAGSKLFMAYKIEQAMFKVSVMFIPAMFNHYINIWGGVGGGYIDVFVF